MNLIYITTKGDKIIRGFTKNSDYLPMQIGQRVILMDRNFIYFVLVTRFMYYLDKFESSKV
jgi:hypothetical protein